MISIFNEEDINNIIKKLNIKFDKFTKDDFITGINIELEHGTINKVTNVTDNDLEKMTKSTIPFYNCDIKNKAEMEKVFQKLLSQNIHY